LLLYFVEAFCRFSKFFSIHHASVLLSIGAVCRCYSDGSSFICSAIFFAIFVAVAYITSSPRPGYLFSKSALLLFIDFTSLSFSFVSASVKVFSSSLNSSFLISESRESNFDVLFLFGVAGFAAAGVFAFAATGFFVVGFAFAGVVALPSQGSAGFSAFFGASLVSLLCFWFVYWHIRCSFLFSIFHSASNIPCPSGYCSCTSTNCSL
jgi:hypothetical protein